MHFIEDIQKSLSGSNQHTVALALVVVGRFEHLERLMVASGLCSGLWWLG